MARAQPGSAIRSDPRQSAATPYCYMVRIANTIHALRRAASGIPYAGDNSDAAAASALRAT
jgi:hypothetical protein